MNMTQKIKRTQLPNGDVISESRFIEAKMTHPEFGELTIQVPLEEGAPDLSKMNHKELDLLRGRIKEAFNYEVEEQEQKSLEQDS